MAKQGNKTGQALAKGGYTLAEMLITIGILGVMAAIAIPLLFSDTTKRDNSIVKQAIAEVTSGMTQLKLDENLNTTSTFADLLPYIKYTRLANGGYIDANPSHSPGDPINCPSTYCSCSYAADPSGTNCMVLSSGAVVMFDRNAKFNGSGANNAIPFLVDMDGKRLSTPNSAMLWLYYDGTVNSRGKGTAVNSAGTFNANGAMDPPWLDLTN